MDNNHRQRHLRRVPAGGNNWLFVSSRAGGDCAAAVFMARAGVTGMTSSVDRYRCRLETSGVMWLFQRDFTTPVGHRKMPTAYLADIVERLTGQPGRS
jgi:hypothetical protein